MTEDVTVYYIAGKQLGPLTVPRSWCEECDLTVRAVESALREADPHGRLGFSAKPWLTHLWPALRLGGWHPPVVVIGGERHSQGAVPEHEALVRRLSELQVSGLPHSAQNEEA